jgi:hypothetical protein
MWQAEQQAKKEAFIADPAKIAAYRALVGQEIEYSVDSLLSNEDVYPNEVIL